MEFCKGQSILGALLLKTFLNDIFMINEQSDIYNLAGDNTLHSCGERLTEIKEKLIFDTKGILNWFRLNSVKTNPWKLQFMILGVKSHYKHTLKKKFSRPFTARNYNWQKINLKQNIENLCRKTQYKFHALRCIRTFLIIEKAKIFTA